MKKRILVQALMGIIAVFIVSGCGQDSKKQGKETDQNLKEAAKETIAEAKAKATSDWQAFKIESERSIAEMEQQANELKTKIATAEKKTQASLTSDLNKLEQKLNEQKAKLKQKNAEFESDLKNYNERIVSKNEQFKKEFRHDMNGLGSAFKDLFKENIK